MSCKTDEHKRSFNKAKKQVKEAGEEVLYGAKKFAGWVKEHPDDAVKLIGGVAIGGLSIAGLIVDSRDRKERMQSLTRIWDPVGGTYIKLRREMTGKEVSEYTTRVASGETRAKVLHSMGLLAK